MKTYRVVLMVILIIVVCMSSEPFRIEGLVQSSEKEPLPFANIRVEGTKIGCISDNNGHFSLTVPRSAIGNKGFLLLSVTYMGYSDRVVKVPLKEKVVVLSIVMRRKILNYSPVTVYGNRYLTLEKSVETSFKLLRHTKFLTVPAPMSGDVFWVLQIMPETGSVSEFSNQLYVRGGSPDQNLILLNGAPIYYNSHLFGLTSSFNRDVIESVEYYTGCFSAKYGNRVSSVLSINTKPGETKSRVSFGADVTGLSSSVSGPVLKSLRYRLTGRFLSYEKLVKVFPYHFYDVEAKVSYIPNRKNLIVYNYFKSFDSYRKVSEEKYRIFSLYGYPDISPVDENDPDSTKCQSLYRNIYEWGIDFHSLRFLYKSGKKNISDFVLYYNKVINGFSYLEALFPLPSSARSTVDLIEKYNALLGYRENSLHADNEFVEYGLRYNYNFTAGKNWEFSTGFDYLRDEIHYGWDYSKFRLISRYINIFMDFPPDTMRMRKEMAYFAFYGESLMNLKRLSVRAGFRVNKYSLYRGFYAEPRLNLTLKLSRTLVVKAGYGCFSQSLSYCTEYGFYNFASLLFPVEEKPIRSTHKIVSLDLTKENINLSVSFYQKLFSNLMFRTEDNGFTRGKGNARGCEIYSTYRIAGNFTFTLSYSYSMVRKKLNGQVFFPNYDQRHRLKMMLESYLGKNLIFSLVYSFSTGRPVNLYRVPAYIPNRIAIFRIDDRKYLDYGDLVPFILRCPLDAIRYPYFSRFDVSIIKKWYLRKFVLSMYVQIINLLNRKNVVYYKGLSVKYSFKDASTDAESGILVPQVKYKLEPFYGFPLLPILGILVEF